ncbi:MAG: PIN domain-containing protein [Oligoflexus sp.]
MASNNFSVIYDACVLYPNALRDFLMWLSLEGFYKAKWTRMIHDEWTRNLNKNHPQTCTLEKLEKIVSTMNTAVPDALIEGFEDLIPSVSLPDPDDRHVLAAAIKEKAQVIVTDNISDFPTPDVAKWDVEAQTADDFVLNCWNIAPAAVVNALTNMSNNKKHPPMSVLEIIEKLMALSPGLKKSMRIVKGELYGF